MHSRYVYTLKNLYAKVSSKLGVLFSIFVEKFGFQDFSVLLCNVMTANDDAKYKLCQLMYLHVAPVAPSGVDWVPTLR